MILIFSYLAVLVFAAGTVYRGLSIKAMPVHLRWELAPVPHEKGKGHYGGSYLEEFEWWTKPREKSLVSEGLYMFQEIVLLKGVWEHNPAMWAFSFPFHFGLYTLAAMAACLAAATFVAPGLGPVVVGLAGAGYILGSVGTLGLLAKRLFDPKLRPFTTTASLFNLALLSAMFLSGCAALLSGGYLSEMTGFVRAFFTADAGVSPAAPVAAHIVIAMLFLIYLPFTYMMHFVAKYFTYHEIRWNDEPMDGDARMQKEVEELLSQPVAWAAPHLGADGKKNWVDIATADIKKETAKDA